jgi:uncharacterized protein YdeI (YjbR/CyaY-like superfamily)
MKTFLARTVGDWRRWLQAHHDSETAVWLIFYKQHTGAASISYHDALDEALCFGWIDSLVKRLDEDRYARKFTPRRPGSQWSAINRKRFGELRADGRLKPAGAMRAPGRRTAVRPPPGTKSQAGRALQVPPYMKAALEKHVAAWRYFSALAPSHRRAYIGWIDSARGEETRARRLREAMRMLKAGKPLGLK